MIVATFNAHDNPRAVARSLEYAGLILWQECPAGYTRGVSGWLSAGGTGDVVTGWRLRWWRLESVEWHTAHPGRAGVTPTRGVLVVVLVHKATGRRVAVVNGHRINRTRGLWLRVPGIHARWRAERWREHDDLERRLVAELVAAGLAVIGGGDYNRRRMALPHPDAFYLAGHSSIDKLWAVDPHGVLEPRELRSGRDSETHELGSDHPLRRARVWFFRPIPPETGKP